MFVSILGEASYAFISHKSGSGGTDRGDEAETATVAAQKIDSDSKPI
jgi:hypothetical protein